MVGRPLPFPLADDSGSVGAAAAFVDDGVGNGADGVGGGGIAVGGVVVADGPAPPEKKNHGESIYRTTAETQVHRKTAKTQVHI